MLDLKKLIDFPSNAVKSSVLKMALEYKDLDLLTEAQALVSSDDLAVQAEAIRYITKTSDDSASTLRGFLEKQNYRIQKMKGRASVRRLTKPLKQFEDL